MTTTQEDTMTTTTAALPIAPLTYSRKGFGDHVEHYAFVPNGDPAWQSPTWAKDGKIGMATYVPGDSYSLRTGKPTSSFAVNLAALNGAL